MKRSERGFLAAGVILLAVSALCTISLILPFLDFGTADSGGGGFLGAFGRMLFTAYGFSSFLIPLYVFVAGLLLFSSDKSKKQIICLFFSFIPFFTVAGVELVTKKIFDGTGFTVNLIRAATVVLVGLLLCLIEYLAIGLAADCIIRALSGRAAGKTPLRKFRFAPKKARKKDFFAEKNEDHTDPYMPLEEEAVAEAEPLEDFEQEPEAADTADDWNTALVQEEDIADVMDAEDAADGADADESGESNEVGADDNADSFGGLNEPELFENAGEAEFLSNPFDFEVIDGDEDIESADAIETEEEAAEELEALSSEPDSPVPVPSVPKKKQSGKSYNVPTKGLLSEYPGGEYWLIDNETRRSAEALKETLNEFKIEAEVTGIRKGPVVTMFEILPAPGVKLSKIVALGDNIALRLAASSVRIVAPIPGKHAVGIEVPNKERAIVGFKELIDMDLPAFKKMAVPVVLGKDIAGDAQVLDLSKTPHLLIAGATGSGKSVCVNSLILSILYKRSPQDVRMILIDPKIVELKLYNDIPHLLTPVITEPKKAFQALQYCLCEMERRYALLDGMGVRDIASYNKRILERKIATEKLPYIVLIVDEFADLMATTGKELESTVARLAAMSRAVGIHLVLATQRPSIDVITGLIKANIPSRIAFMVASKMDSRIIIDQVGAEKLLGKGDMLYASAEVPFPMRIQGTFVSDTEVENVVEFVKQYGEPEYIDDEIFVEDEDEGFDPGVFSEGEDPLYDKALEIVMQAGKASASYIQRRLKIGYNRAARLVEDMEARGIVGPANGSKPREVIHVV